MVFYIKLAFYSVDELTVKVLQAYNIDSQFVFNKYDLQAM